jgi:hypothetical protein
LEARRCANERGVLKVLLVELEVKFGLEEHDLK